MQDISIVKSPKLRELIDKSLKFTALSDEEQSVLLNTISQFSPETQEKIYCPFFEGQNADEAGQNKEINELMAEDYAELDKKFTSVERADLEEHDKTKDNKNMDAMLYQLKTI